jgi:hypothetical protein
VDAGVLVISGVDAGVLVISGVDAGVLVISGVDAGVLVISGVDTGACLGLDVEVSMNRTKSFSFPSSVTKKVSTFDCINNPRSALSLVTVPGHLCAR